MAEPLLIPLVELRTALLIELLLVTIPVLLAVAESLLIPLADRDEKALRQKLEQYSSSL